MYRILFFLLTWTLYCSTIHAQQHYTKSNGLLSNTVYNSFRDSRGYIWFCTDKGVSRFDGKNFKNYTTADGIPDNSIVNFFEDRAGRLWLFCVNGASCYIYHEKVFTASNSKVLANLPVVAFQRTMCDGDDSTMYIGYSRGPLIKLNLNNGAVTDITPDTAVVIPAMQYMHDTLYVYDTWNGCIKYYHDKIISINNDRVNISSCYGITRFTTYGTKTDVYKNATLVASVDHPTMQTVIKIVPYDNNSFFSCTRDGLFLVDYTHHRKRPIWTGIKVTSISQSISGNYWVTTLDKGIYQLNRQIFDVPLIAELGEDDLLQCNDHLLRVHNDSLYSFDRTSLAQEAIKCKYETSWNIAAEDDDYLIYNQYNNTVFLNRKTGIAYKNSFTPTIAGRLPAYSVCIPHDNGQYYVATPFDYANLFITNGKAHYTFDHYLAERNGQRVKGCLFNRHLYMLTSNILREIDANGNNEKTIDRYTDLAPLDIFCFNNHIMVTAADKIIVYTQGTKKRTIYSLNGLGLSNIVRASGNKFVAATNTGYQLLTFLDTPAKLIYEHIVSPFNSSDISYVYNCGPHLLMNVNSNLYKVDPTIINTHITRPVFFINNVLVNNIKDTSRHIILNNTGGNNIFISLSPLYFGNPNISYKYRFIKDHNNSQWFYSDGGEFNLSLPSYGDYKIEFAAVADNNNTSASQFLYVSWPPPFYLTWWFFTIIGLLFVALIVYMVYLNNERRKLKFEKEMDQLQLEHKAINSLLNPHFVFNAINNIQNLVNKYRVDDANEYLARLSRLIRQNIENLQFNLITADKELSLIRNYIYLQNLRFNDKIHLQINNTADADKLCLPPLLIHTFVENSVVHGFSPDIKDFTITIDIHPDGKDYVSINITDNGLGLNKPTQAQQVLKDKTSIGVDATRRRLQKLSEFYKVQYKLDITDRQATEGTSGARVSIRFYAHFGNLLPVN
ncbi:MAG: histidine kinase [Bacteroidetes bacterium]|nr:histidine kinase [Bacteroidota bacterium]